MDRGIYDAGEWSALLASADTRAGAACHAGCQRDDPDPWHEPAWAAEALTIREAGGDASHVITGDPMGGRCDREPAPVPEPAPIGDADATGRWLAGRLESLDQHLEELLPSELVDMITDATRLARWAEAVQLRAIRAMTDYAAHGMADGDEPLQLPGGPGVVDAGFRTGEDVDEFLADHLAVIMGTSRTAADLAVTAASMSREVPQVAERHRRGEIDLARIKVLATELQPIADDAGFVGAAVPEAIGRTPTQLRRHLRARVLAERPELAADRHREEYARRRVWVRHEADGMATLGAYLVAEDAIAARNALTAAAHARRATFHDDCPDPAAPECRSADPGLDAHRADVLRDLLVDLQHTMISTGEVGPIESCGDDGRRTGRDDTAGGRLGRKQVPRRPRTMVHLFLNASTLAGCDDLPADLLGHGPVDAEHARAIAGDAELIRILTDPVSGDIRAIDTPAYRVPAILRWATIARDRTCTWPGCTAAATTTDYDHVDPHPGGRRGGGATGRTRYDSGQSLCRHHHRVKTHGHWMPGPPDERGAVQWRSPTGHTYPRAPSWTVTAARPSSGREPPDSAPF